MRPHLSSALFSILNGVSGIESIYALRYVLLLSP